MQDEAPTDHDPYDDFEVVEERMPDGRVIRYYSWPESVDEQAAEPDV